MSIINTQAPELAFHTEAPEKPSGPTRPKGARRAVLIRRVLSRFTRNRPAAFLAMTTILGLAGTVGFGIAWSAQTTYQHQAAQVRATSVNFLMSLTNFNPNTVDADFARISGYATGNFANQAHQFFGTKIRQELETTRAASRGQVRHLFVESLSARSASVYAVVDQTYANAKMGAPNADVLRLVLQLDRAPGSKFWKIADVTVLQPPSVYSGTAATSASLPGASGLGAGKGGANGLKTTVGAKG